MFKRMYAVSLAVTLMVLGVFIIMPATAQAEVVVPDGWAYELFADVDGIQYVSGPNSSYCPVGAYSTTVDEQGYVYLATSSCSTTYFWIIRVEPDGSAWDKFGSHKVRDLDGVYANTVDGQTYVYASGGYGGSRFLADGTRVGLYSGVYGNVQFVAADSKGDMYISTIYAGVFKVDTETGAVSKFLNVSGDTSVIAIDTEDNLYVSNVNRILKVAPDGSYEVIRNSAGFVTAHPSGDLYLSVGGNLERMYENPDGTWSSELFAQGISGHLAWSKDGNTLYISKGKARKIYIMYRNSVEATIDIDPDVLNLKSKGNFITAYIELPADYDVADIYLDTLMLNGTVPAEMHPATIGDYDNDGIADLMVKFDRASVQDIVSVGDAVEMTVTGSMADGSTLNGTDVIRVINPGGKK